MKYFWLFISLQLADLVTTLVGLHHGAVEGNALVAAWFQFSGPIPGLLIVKALALLGAVGIYLRHGRVTVYRDLSVVFVAVVAWNCYILTRLS